LDERYHQISYYLRRVHLPFLLDFTFLNRGICVGRDWYPVLKMQWVEGFTLNQFVKDHLDKPQALKDLGQLWLKLASRLREADMAHRDLQHGNVLLVPGRKARSLRVKLVDYDGIWVPALASFRSVEVGHPSYQHPQRQREGIYSSEVDQFSHLVIYTALRGLVVGGRSLWEKYDNGDNLLFTREDLEAPSKSRLFYDLLKLDDPTARFLAESLIDAARRPLDQTPLLLEPLVAVERPAPRFAQRERGRVQPVAVGPALWSRVPPPVRSDPAEPVEVPPAEVLSVPASPHPEPPCLPPRARRFALGLLAIVLTTLAGVIIAAILLTASNHAPSGEVAASRPPVEMPRHPSRLVLGGELPSAKTPPRHPASFWWSLPLGKSPTWRLSSNAGSCSRGRGS
jgi:hypothetical protein